MPGLDVNGQGIAGNTAIHTAVKKDQVACLKALIKIPRIAFNMEDNNGDTALLCLGGVSWSKTDGVNITIKDKDDKTLEELARYIKRNDRK